MCNAETAGNPLEIALEAIQRFVKGPTLELTPVELGEHLIRLRHGIDLLELAFASGAATFASTDEYELAGSVTPIDWIRHHCHMSGHAAAKSVAAGEQVHRLPASAVALDAGEIGFAHFSLLAGVARAVSARPGAADLDAGGTAETSPADGTDPADPSVSAAAIGFDEHSLLELAREHSVGRFSRECTHACHVYELPQCSRTM